MSIAAAGKWQCPGREVIWSYRNSAMKRYIARMHHYSLQCRPYPTIEATEDVTVPNFTKISLVDPQ